MQKYVDAKGLQLLFNCTTFALPTNSVPVFKAGVEFVNSNARVKFLTNMRTGLIENNFTYLARPSLVVGWNLVLDPRV